MNLFNIRKSSLESAKKFFETHLQVFYCDLDPLQHVEDRSQVDTVRTHLTQPRNNHYLFPFALSLYIFLDSLYILYNAGFKYSSHGLPDLFIHRITSEEFWPQS